MKASLKFREDRKPLIRAKVPLSILGLPFQSGVVAGEPRELALHLGTSFGSGPSLRLSYRPNDSASPFSLAVRTGTGPLGSPAAGSVSMSAEFDLVRRGSPRFMLHFRPAFGDFSIKKLQSSSSSSSSEKAARPGFGGNGVGAVAVAVAEEDPTIEVVEAPAATNGGFLPENVTFFGKRITAPTPDSPAGILSGMLSGMEVAARTAVPVRRNAAVSFRWGVRVPVEMEGVGGSGIKLTKIPFLVMNKIGIEHVESTNSKAAAKVAPEPKFAGGVDVAEACFSMKHQLEVLQAENGSLKKAIEDLRQEFSARKSNSPVVGTDSSKYREFERNGNRHSSAKVDSRGNGKKPSMDSSAYSGKSMEADVGEELKKSFKGASGA
ncbi:uncharacterized protein LOC115674829 [Syzygium oleosum]|uniref:uncharacterized protein LOC115674829 n=1 Tax=Syzygium oleosum TaxID=219896 RepID=UPI0011D28D56|nr:uncharacterized protein LOC115674829 [Syzygium oleosum]